MFTIPCTAGRIRSKLRHTIVENTFLALSEPLLRLHLRENPSLPTTVGSLVGELAVRLQREYDPALLLERLPGYHGLSSADKQNVRMRVHELYVQEFQPSARATRLITAWEASVSALNAWLAAEDPNDAHEYFRDFRLELQAFNVALIELPKGVWLP